MALDSQVNADEQITNEETAEYDKRVTELLDDKYLHNLLIQRLHDGGHVAKRPILTVNKDSQPVPGHNLTACFPVFPSGTIWGTIYFIAHDRRDGNPSIPILWFHKCVGSASVQGQEAEGDEDVLNLLVGGE